MANPDHLELLRQGVEVWNKWRYRNRTVAADLSGADLREFDLAPAVYHYPDNSPEASPYGIDFAGARLANAMFMDMELWLPDFNGATLAGANLTGTRIYDGDLRNASLRDADLWATQLWEVELAGADLTGAVMHQTVFFGLDLSQVRGLDAVNHRGPSALTIETIARSQGRISEAFLRGCGIPDNFIETIRNVAAHPVRLNSCFISYSSKDQEFGERLHTDLQNRGVRCWFAAHDIQGGQKVAEQIAKAISVHDRVLLVLSENSMNSEWVKTEIANARRRETKEQRRILFPIRLVPFDALREWQCFDADCGKDSAREIREYFIPDFSEWKDANAYDEAFDRLLRDLEA